MKPRFFKMKTIVVFITLFFATSIIVKGQSDYRPGYCITLESDTIHGWIDYRGESRNSKVCTFKTNENAEQKILLPNDIYAYKYQDSKLYVSKTIETNGKQTPAFVEFLVDGITDLYYYRDPNDSFYLLEDQRGTFFKIKKESEIVQIIGKEGTYVKDSYQHIAMLRMAFSDCMEIQPQIDHISITHKALINLTTDYHDYVCDDQKCIVYEKKLALVRFQFSPVVGTAVSNLSFEGGLYSRFTYDPSITPMYGISINTILPRLSEKISYQLDVLYNRTEIEGIYRGYYKLFINSHTIRPSFAVKYSFPKGKVRPTFALGVIGNYFIEPEYRAIIDNVPDDAPQEYEMETTTMATNLYGGLAQLGCDFHFIKNVALFSNIRYSYYTGLKNSKTEMEIVKTKINTLDIGIGMYF